MRIIAVAFTDKGLGCANELSKRDFIHEVEIVYKPKDADSIVKKCFSSGTPLLFICAMGIAVRLIANYISNKLNDIPVVVMDEAARFVIPVLSGHVGGANDLAYDIAKEMSATPVITTATDINNTFAIDMFAKENGLKIINKDGIKKVSSKVLRNEAITMLIPGKNLPEDINIDKVHIDVDVLDKNDDNEQKSLLSLLPKPYVIGIGAKKGICAETVRDLVEKCIRKLDIDIEEIAFIASIDIKKDEAGIVDFARINRIPFITFSANELSDVTGEFNESAFVNEQIGVGNVCERAAIAACDNFGEIILEKTAQNGVTIAIAKRNWRVKVG